MPHEKTPTIEIAIAVEIRGGNFIHHSTCQSPGQRVQRFTQQIFIRKLRLKVVGNMPTEAVDMEATELELVRQLPEN